MLGMNSAKAFLDEKLVTPQKNTAAIAILALTVAGIALIVAMRKGK